MINRPLVVIESPFAGDVETNIFYADCLLLDSLNRGEAPFLGHLLYTRVYNDSDSAQRAAGIAAHISLIAKADKIIVGMDLGELTPGMQQALLAAANEGKTVEERRLGPDWYNRYRPSPTPGLYVFPAVPNLSDQTAIAEVLVRRPYVQVKVNGKVVRVGDISATPSGRPLSIDGVKLEVGDHIVYDVLPSKWAQLKAFARDALNVRKWLWNLFGIGNKEGPLLLQNVPEPKQPNGVYVASTAGWNEPRGPFLQTPANTQIVERSNSQAAEPSAADQSGNTQAAEPSAASPDARASRVPTQPGHELRDVSAITPPKKPDGSTV